jgi:DNA (cytosine-5)-methyltransferase 1
LGQVKAVPRGASDANIRRFSFCLLRHDYKVTAKVFILENVKGIIQGNAKAYSKAIVKKMQEAGYTVQVFCLNAASMGVPQKRERVFFIGHKKEFGCLSYIRF